MGTHYTLSPLPLALPPPPLISTASGRPTSGRRKRTLGKPLGSSSATGAGGSRGRRWETSKAAAAGGRRRVWGVARPRPRDPAAPARFRWEGDGRWSPAAAGFGGGAMGLVGRRGRRRPRRGGGGGGSRVWGGERRGEARPRGVGRKERRRRTGGGCLLGLLVFVVDAAAGGRAGESWAGLPVHGLLLLPPRAGFFLLGSSGTGWWVNKLAFCFGEFDSHASRNKQSVLETITRFINSTRTTCPLY
jgi:hypothetical protein